MSAMQALMERELGRAALELLEKESTMTAVVQAAENRALGIVQALQTVLDDPALSDSDCIEEITGILIQNGIPVNRHDYG